MQVTLRDLKPNPFRDFAVDPVDDEQVEALTKSIEKNDFWGGVAVRDTGTEKQVAAGWHRIKAAIEAGKVTADLFVAPLIKMTDHDMIRIYATENATHRGELGTALAGSVASAVKFIARGLLTGDIAGFPAMWSQKAIDSMRGNLQGEKGIGWSAVLDFLKGIPGINKNTVIQQLSNLKASGIYDRLIGEVQADLVAIEKAAAKAAAEAERERKAAEKAAAEAKAERKAAAEQREREREQERLAKAARDAEIAAEKEAAQKRKLEEKAQREAERAEREEERRVAAEARAAEKAARDEEKRAAAEAKAAEKEAAAAARKAEKEAADKAKAAAKEQERKLREEKLDFDFEGVSKWLKVADHVNQFRALMKAKGVAPHVTRDDHAALAEAVVKAFKAEKIPSSRFAAFMDQHILALALERQRKQRKISREEEEEAQRRDAYRKAAKKLVWFATNVRSAKNNLWQLLDLAKVGGLNPTQHNAFRAAIEGLVEVMEACRKAGFSTWAREDDLARLTTPSRANGKYHKLVAHLGNSNAGERHNAADALNRAARSKGVSVAELLGLE